MDNLIAVCYVIENRTNGFINPTIHLNEPEINLGFEKLHKFYTVFQAKNFIREKMGYGVVLEVNKEQREIYKKKIHINLWVLTIVD